MVQGPRVADRAEGVCSMHVSTGLQEGGGAHQSRKGGGRRTPAGGCGGKSPVLALNLGRPKLQVRDALLLADMGRVLPFWR